MIGESFAKRLWPNGGAVGARIRPFSSLPWKTVVGVVRDIREPGDERRPWHPQLFMAMPAASSHPFLLFRSHQPLERMLPPITAAIHEANPLIAVGAAATADAQFTHYMSMHRFTLTLLGAFASLALVLAIVGLHSVVAFSVNQRSREIGVRMALGAAATSVVALVVRQAMTLALIGVVVGAVAGATASRALRSMLYGVGTTDPVTIAGVAVVLVGGALFAAYAPARRAARQPGGCVARGLRRILNPKGGNSEAADVRVRHIPGLCVDRCRPGTAARWRGTGAGHVADELGRVAGGVRDQTSGLPASRIQSRLLYPAAVGCTNYEKPFLYLIFGDGQALLVDTGARGARVADAIADALKRWADAHGKPVPQLIAAHSHARGDHVAGDSALATMTGVTVVGTSPEAVQRFFGLKAWPDSSATFDLGGRMLDIIPIPGHERASIAIYDRRTGILLTGDTMYPGRLYVADAAALAKSARRLVDFTRDLRVAHVLGAHIEQARTPFLDYTIGTSSARRARPRMSGAGICSS